MFAFSDKIVLVTGARGGIGGAVARVFFDLGATCVLTDLDQDAVIAAARALDPSGARAIGAAQDVTRSADADSVVGMIRERFGRLDIVVAGAGLYVDQPVGGMSDEAWRQTIAVNLDGVFYTCRAALPAMPDGGAIVALASMAGHRGSRHHAHYAAAKGAVLTFARSLAIELAPRIRVNAVSPGLIDTPMVRPLMAVNGPALLAQTPLQRLGTSMEVARAVAFLCSDWASFITGETLHVNGGLYIAS